MIDLKKITMSHVKDAIYIITIVLGVYYFFRDKAVNQAVEKEQREILDSLLKRKDGRK
jgi:hypothetical protein